MAISVLKIVEVNLYMNVYCRYIFLDNQNKFFFFKSSC